MSTIVSSTHDEDLALVKQCLTGENEAMSTIQERCHKRLLNHLIGRGATETEAGDLLADLWTECAVGRLDRRPLFEKYHGKCGLYTWLVTVSIHRLVDLKRRQKFQGSLPSPGGDNSEVNNFDQLPGRVSHQAEKGLIDVMQRALRDALSQCEPAILLILQLVYIHGIMQREVARIFGWHESKVSRTLDAAMADIQERTLAAVRRADPWLELTWEDFLDLCAYSENLFNLRR